MEAAQPRAGRGAKFWAFLIAAIVVVVFIALNSQEVDVNFLVGKTEAPLIFALGVSTVLGFLIGYLAAILRRGD